MPTPRRPRDRLPAGAPKRYRALLQVLEALRVLSSGRWRAPEAAAQLGVGVRTLYRLVAVLEAAGVVVERHPEGSLVYLRVRRAQARRALGLE